MLLGFGLEVVLVEKGAGAQPFEGQAGAELLTEARLVGLEGNFGDFKATIEAGGQIVWRTVGAVVVAVGVRTEPAKEVPLAITLTDFRRRMAAGEPIRNVCFLMDLEQSTPLAEFSLGLQFAFEAAQKKTSVYFLCRDVKVAEEGLERLYRSAREEGVLFIKNEARPTIAPLAEAASIQVMDLSPGAGSHLSRLCLTAEVIVVPEAFFPSEDNPGLAALLATDLDTKGYFQPANVRLAVGRTNRRGLFVLGDCRGPSSVAETIERAEATAQEIASLLGEGEKKVDWPVAVVDPEKCAYCLTCNRICPHKAAGMNLEEESAVIYASACYGCGLCVAECPSVAITIEKFSDAALVSSFASGGAG